MPTVAEVLKSAGIADEVASGLNPEVVKALSGFVADADTKLTTAQQEAVKAEEARRQAELEREEINQYVEQYGTSLTKMSGVEAKNKALVTYLKSLKDQGFEVPVELMAEEANNNGGNRAAVPGSPAIGGNAVDESKILGKVGDVMSQWLDANNEHIRLFGVPIPEQSTPLAQEAARARKPIGEYIAEKFKFSAKRKEVEQAAYQKRVDDEVNRRVEEERRKHAEERGSNPNLRPGEASRNSFVPKIKGEEFHKSDGNRPAAERRKRLLDNIHAELQEKTA